MRRIELFLLLAFLIGLSAFAEADAVVDEARIQQLEAQIEALADQLESRPSAAEQQTKLGGYGELHYNGDLNGDDQIDFHRWVLFLDHQFNSRIKLVSELELEHAIAADGEAGAVELEQAYISIMPSGQSEVKLGLFLMPVGIINETHEPTTFYGVERNPVEKNIIPTTWWEGGAVYSRHFPSGFAYDVALHSGLAVEPGSLDIRKGRQRNSEAPANSGAATLRLQYSGMPGLKASVSLQHQADLDQGLSSRVGSANLYEGHLIWQPGPLQLILLYVGWDIQGQQARLLNKTTQSGGYLELGYRINPQFGIFARQNQWSLTEGVDQQQSDVGLNWWLHEDVVLKLDYQRSNAAAGDKELVNLGLGYQF